VQQVAGSKIGAAWGPPDRQPKKSKERGKKKGREEHLKSQRKRTRWMETTKLKEKRNENYGKRTGICPMGTGEEFRLVNGEFLDLCGCPQILHWEPMQLGEKSGRDEEVILERLMK